MTDARPGMDAMDIWGKKKKNKKNKKKTKEKKPLCS